MSKQTAMQEMLQWVRQALPMELDTPLMIEAKIESLLEMEKQQIIDAHTKGYLIGGGNGDLYDCKQYYNETFNK